MSKQEEYFDEEYGYDIMIWVETTKSFVEFEASLSHIIDPVPIENHKFKLGAIGCEIRSVNPNQAPTFPDIPSAEYRYCIAVPKSDLLIWGCFDHQFAFALTLGLRTRFSCRYMVTAEDDFFIAYSGTNLPMYLNTYYKPWASGELAAFRELENKEVRLPKVEAKGTALTYKRLQLTAR
ncbi:MAG: hypothetical protein ACR2LM_06015 [Pyrinomonadaceae bacterium]